MDGLTVKEQRGARFIQCSCAPNPGFPGRVSDDMQSEAILYCICTLEHCRGKARTPGIRGRLFKSILLLSVEAENREVMH